MKTLTQLQEERGRLVTQAREALDEIKKNTDEARASELTERHDKIMAEFDGIDGLIEREQRVAAVEKRAEEERAQRRPIPGDGERPGAEEQRGDNDKYRMAFREMLLNGGNVADLNPETRAALKAGLATGAEFRAQSTSNSAGGYTVPVTLANFIVKSMAAWGPMYDDNLCTVISTSSGEQINIPTIDDTAVAVAKHTENGALTDDGGVDVTVGQKVLNAYVFDTEFVKWSLELTQDSNWNWEQLLGELLGERLGRRANVELTTGDGSGDPNGIVTASTLGKTAAGTAALTCDELIDLQHSVDPAYRQSPKARFMFNDSTLAAIRKLKGGDGQYIWQMGDIRAGVPGALLGSPYSVNQAMASLGTGNKTVVFGDFGKYFVRKVGAPVIGVMRERFWPDLGIAGLIRFDGELGDTAAVKHLIQA
jgi:HK97 family phage major capsid protein